MGFQSVDTQDVQRSVSEMVLAEVKRTFNPEFINRVDEIIVFDALVDEDLRKITRMLVAQLNENLSNRGIRISIAPEVVDWIVEMTCQDRSYGARPLRRAIQRYIEDPLSEELIRGNLESDNIEIYLESGTVAYRMARETAAGHKLA